jgi:hypothetical protein
VVFGRADAILQLDNLMNHPACNRSHVLLRSGQRNLVQGDRKMVGPTGNLARNRKLSLDRCLDLFAKMVYKLGHGLKPDLTGRAAGHRVLAIAIRYGLRVIIEIVFVKFNANDFKKFGSVHWMIAAP